MKIQREKQTESHDWFAEASEAFVRYCFAKAGYLVFGSSKWGADCVIQDEKSGKMLTVEVKSTDADESANESAKRFKNMLKKKLKKMQNCKIKPHIFAGVRLAKDKSRTFGEIKIELSVIDPEKNCLKAQCECLHLNSNEDIGRCISNWIERYF